MSKAFACAVRLLARREHSAYELASKLAQKGHLDKDIQQALEESQRLSLQSDRRFAESLCRARIRQGYGPVRIRQELQSKQVDTEIIEALLQEEDDNWLNYAICVWKKKYKEAVDVPYAVKQKQKQFLLYRGFSTDTIAQLFK